MQHRDDRGRFARPRKQVNRPTLVTILKIEACRAGVKADEEGDQVRLSSHDGAISELLPLDEACAVVAMLRGTYCSPHVIEAGGLKIVSP